MRRNREILEYGRYYFMLKIKKTVNRLRNNYRMYIAAQKIKLKFFTYKNRFHDKNFRSNVKLPYSNQIRAGARCETSKMTLP